MTIISLVAANTALRLDPGLVPPKGTVVRWHVIRGFGAPEGHLNRSPEGRTGTVRVCFRLAGRLVMSVSSAVDGTVLNLFPEYGEQYEILKLPEGCPPLSEWLCTKDLYYVF